MIPTRLKEYHRIISKHFNTHSKNSKKIFFSEGTNLSPLRNRKTWFVNLWVIECHWNYLVIIHFLIRNGSVHYKAYYVCFHVSLIKLAPQFYLDVPSATNPLISNILLDWNYVVTTIMFFHMCEIGNWVKFC